MTGEAQIGEPQIGGGARLAWLLLHSRRNA